MSRIARDLATSPHKPFFGSEPEYELKHSFGTMNHLRAGKLPHVAVVGAGFSGLRCADVLVRAGFRVTIFEARDRVGGRVHQIKSGGHLVDTGPNWIHGTVGNPISRLAQKTGTPVMELEERQIIFNPNGRQMSEKDSGHIAEEIWGMIIQAFKYSDEKSAMIDSKMSLMDYFKQELPKRFPNDQNKIDTLITEARMWGPFVGEPIERQSLKFFFLEECLDGENTLMAGTYQKVLQEVSRVALEQAEIRLQEEVIQIDYRTTDDGTPVTIQTKCGGKHTFDEVVVSCPLGWLKRNELTAFTPPLPERLSEAIQNIGYGKLEKLYVSFPSAFWLENGDVEGDRNRNRQKDFSYPCFTHFQQPTYHPFPESKNSLSWNQSVVSLAHLPHPTAHPTLLFYIYGDCGTYLTRLLDKHEPHSTTYDKLLDDFAQPFYSRLPNYLPTSDSCKPTSYYLTSWQLDPFAGYGSYSNFQIGLENGDEDIEVMRNAGGLSKQGRGLWLAGEHNAPFVAIGTTTGAWWSGEGVARRIIKQYGLNVEEDVLSLAVNEAGKETKDVNGQVDATVRAASPEELHPKASLNNGSA